MTCVSRTRRLLVSRRTRRGFTLIEVLMAAFVMAIGVLGLTALFAGAARQQQLSSQTTRAVAAARSADAFIAERFGPIERVDGTATLARGDVPANDQGDTDIIENDQWYVIPRASDGSLSLNPRESVTGWKAASLHTRAVPREPLPKLLYRARMERRPNEFIPTGLNGTDPTGVGLGEPLVRNSFYGAPNFDGGIRELRAIPDSFTVRVITRAFPCQGSTTRSITAPDDQEIILRWDNSGDINNSVFTLTDGPGDAIMRIKIDGKSKDSELLSNGSASEFIFAKVDQVIKDTKPTADCAGDISQVYVVTAEPPTGYIWKLDDPVATPGDISEGDTPLPEAGYDLIEENNAGVTSLVAKLRPVDVREPGRPVYVKGQMGSGDYVWSADGMTAPPEASLATAPTAAVREAEIPDRFIHEIWLVEYAYRGHTLASLPETVAYGEATEAGVADTPQLGYSMLFRRTSNSAVQYALMSYAIAPTYSASANKASKTDDDFFPAEDQDDVANKSSPLRLVKGLDLEFDEALGQYYFETKDVTQGWLVVPGQMLMFNGDASATPPIPGADSPVTVVNVRKLPGGVFRAYLDNPPRASLRALPDLVPNKGLDAWAVAPSCEVRQKNYTSKSPIFHWGLRPIGARIFTITN